MAAPTIAARAPIAPATGAFLKAAPVVEAGAEERLAEAETLALGVPEATEVAGRDVPGAEVPGAEVPGAEETEPVPEGASDSDVPEGATLETMGGETVSIRG